MTAHNFEFREPHYEPKQANLHNKPEQKGLSMSATYLKSLR